MCWVLTRGFDLREQRLALLGAAREARHLDQQHRLLVVVVHAVCLAPEKKNEKKKLDFSEM